MQDKLTSEETEKSKPMDDPELQMGETGISVSLSSFMTAVVLFFTGLLLTANYEIQLRLRFPLLFLFISSFGFLFSTLIYANASGEISRLNKINFNRQMAVGNILSEYLGVYCLIFALPIVVLGYSPDKILSIMVLIISIIGFLIYHKMGFSILERYFPTRKILYLVILFLISFYLSSFLFFYFNVEFLHMVFSILTLLLIFLITTLSIRRKEC